MTTPAHVWLESYRSGPEPHSYRFSQPCDEIVVHNLHDMPTAFEALERAVLGGCHAVCVFSYEAGPAFDDALQVVDAGAGSMPLAWVGVYAERDTIVAGSAGPPESTFSASAWTPQVDACTHGRAVEAIRTGIGAGDAYQVNYTFPVQARFSGDPARLYRQMCRSQGSAAFCAYIDLGHTCLLSASPELFFALDAHGGLRTRPMKGTRRRGRWTAEDDALRQQLTDSPKDRAENLMIVDLLRNDLGRVAEAGSVHVDALWETEPYDTVWQMTSTVSARARHDARLWDVFAALFPCGSITGAPKVQASRVIRDLEGRPRGPYTGSIGYVSPACASSDSPTRGLAGMEAVFSVAIRTVVADRDAGRLTAGAGGGITWDSGAEAEYAECMDKVRFLAEAGRTDQTAEFELFETLLFDVSAGYYLVERHLQRLQDSARYFGFACDETHVRAVLHDATAGWSVNARVRLRLARNGAAVAEAQAFEPEPDQRTAVVVHGVDADNVFLYHKTTRRGLYERALAQAQQAGAQEAILCNTRGELTECTIGNLVVQSAGSHHTPALACGLLPGVFRQELLAAGQLHEAVLTEADLHAAEAVFMINSVRRWVPLDTGPWTGPAQDSRPRGATCIE